MADVSTTPAGLVSVDGGYPADVPYHPDEAFPEYGTRPISGTPNPVYRAVRALFHRLEFDRVHFGTARWNPLGHLVRPGDRVFIKPNLVTHEYRKSCGCDGELFSVITHPSVVRAVADYVAIALQGQGEIVIGDNASIDADFNVLLERTRLDALPAVFADLFQTRCRVLDLRPLWTPNLKDYGFRSGTAALAGDPEGSTVLNLGRASRFFGIDPARLRGVFSDRGETIRHHCGERQEYSISNTILNADVFVSIPKLKAHHKVGATLNIKGLVGINSNKNLLPHWQIGYPAAGGDEFPVAHRALDPWRLRVLHTLEDALPERLFLAARSRVPDVIAQLFERRTLHSHERYRGAWDGNDTCWRMAADLYALFIQDRTSWRPRQGKPPLRTLSVIDGVIAGEGDGPFCPTPRHARVLLASEDLLTADAVAVRYMDFDLRGVRYLAALLDDAGLDPAHIPVTSDLAGFDRCFRTNAPFGRFRAPQGWPRLSTAAVEQAA